MPDIRIKRPWELSDSQVTPEKTLDDRRRFLKSLGLFSLAAAGVVAGAPIGCAAPGTGDGRGRTPAPPNPPPGGDALYPARRSGLYAVDRPLTDEATAARYNNYYEFTEQKDVWRYVDRFATRPWRLEVGGLCDAPESFDIDDLARTFPLEERVYRHRCVEAWSMVVPWTGFPLGSLIARARPRSAARFVRFLAFLKPEEAAGQKEHTWYPWPYYEALTIGEATNELAFLVTGIYGHALPVQHGAPLRLALPWKYGFKSIKGIVRIELVDRQPKTFWSDVSSEYDFGANVNPNVPHPRWSQATERVIDTGDRIPTRIFNGYAGQVGDLYPNEAVRPRG